MRPTLVLAVMFLSAAPGLAQEEVPRPQTGQIVEQEAEQPAPQLVELDSSLLKAQEDRQQGRLDEKGYQEFLAKLRVDLEAAISLVTPTPANTALHARILSRLGNSEQALAALAPALEQDPASPALRVALSRVRYDQKDYPAALAEANAVLARDPANKDALALKHSSMGRIGTSGLALGIVAGADHSIPQTNDISPQAMALIHQAISARRDGDMARSWKNMQAAMNADPTSVGVQKLYLVARKDHAKYAQTKDYLRSSQAVQPLQPPSEHPAPKGGVPLWPIGAGLGLTAIGYGVAKSKGVWSDPEAEQPEDEDPDSPRIQRNRRRFKIAGVSAAVGFGIVYGGLWVAGTGAPFAAKLIRDGTDSLQRVATSQTGYVGARTGIKTIRWSPATGKGPLGHDEVLSFRGGSYTETVLDEPILLYRVYGGAAAQLRSYWTRVPPTGPLQSRMDSALRPEWGNTAEKVAVIRLPARTTFYEGYAASQGNLLGGGNQVFVPIVKPEWVVK